MTYSLRRFFVMSVLSVGSLTFVLQPKPAHALVGGATLFPPLMIAGGVAMGVGGVTMALSVPLPRATAHWGTFFFGLSLGLLGFVLLDEKQDSYSFQPLSQVEQQKFGLTDIELNAYNATIENGQIEEIFQEATVQLNGIKKPTWGDAQNVMGGWLSIIDPNASRAFGKIAASFVQ